LKTEVWEWNNQYSFQDQGISFLENPENLKTSTRLLWHVYIFISSFITWKQNNLRLKLHTVMWLSVTIYRVWIGNCIHWTLTNLWLQVIITVSLTHTLQFTRAHS
jgi:hypothetical protein